MDNIRRCAWVIKSDINNVCSLIKQIICYISSCTGELDECSLFELKVILNELVLNAIKHGNNEDINKDVKISLIITDERIIYLYVEDQGSGYDYKCILNNNMINDSDLDLFEMKETGRGILIVKNLCDSIKFNSKGNKIKVVKKLVKI